MAHCVIKNIFILPAVFFICIKKKFLLFQINWITVIFLNYGQIARF